MTMSEFVELDKVLEILAEELSLSESLKRLIKLPRLQYIEKSGAMSADEAFTDYSISKYNKNENNINWEDDEQLLKVCRKSGSLDPRWWREDLR